MKRLLLFGYDPFYPEGGMNDFLGDFDNVDTLKNFLEMKLVVDYSYLQVLDTKRAKVSKIQLNNGKYVCTSDNEIPSINDRQIEAQMDARR
ncbi:hypothetical protein FZC83_02005 [Rossellomorea marisflavi]|uniref:Uncharacterized protein n=1 Tax=Rossellomorea marisflavi TaxID=189381 RepID=A0A5D4S0A8_9BACI|nr:hypothetical protein [Rossellomorea marisflavi]TYS56369.1 hypothetical protein FZC83_02005 [Rossellomorea marisflavi]